MPQITTPDTLAKLLDNIEQGPRTVRFPGEPLILAHLLKEDKALLLALSRWALTAREALDSSRDWTQDVAPEASQILDEALSSFPNL
jgi:hypothetical protein